MKGHVRTEGSGTAVRGVGIHVEKDGAWLAYVHEESGRKGAFELELTHGAGTYRFHASPRCGDGEIKAQFTEEFTWPATVRVHPRHQSVDTPARHDRPGRRAIPKCRFALKIKEVV